MKIRPEEIDHIEEAGELDGSPVKLIRTTGGFWIAVGRPQGRPSEQALSAGSHPAIVKFNIEKQFQNFRPSMMKSALFASEPMVERHSHFLSDEMRDAGHDIFSVQVGPRVDFFVTQHNMKRAEVKAMLKNEALICTKVRLSEETVRAVASAIAEKSLGLGVKVSFE